ncbi:restriction endonuclease subunit S [Vibrio parahaemolyticus]|uniref:restriction endonuclease subunit S n=1 Tax=Vibrio parahaemolyticus TaxID=670 RepID=UPI001EEDAACC|nr:restriction endonuclease subunit S [Vibrio parahaemolyticus]UJW93656.1 restriction endonuclease subunit S [Vibrio parahaemolyticus]HBB9946068.1 restriction endonuclease subunit S [Vibrio parahaemolyticus]HBB9947521.1 restriction endonuclease subunit S [Vibrio parahaemolyticus]
MAGRYKAYPKYQNTDINWLGKAPSHWTLVPCRSLVEHIVEKNHEGRINNYLSLMANVGVIRYEDKGDVGNKKPDDLTKCKIVRKGQLVINSMNYAIGSYGMSPYDGVCSPVYIVLEAKKDVFLNRFALRVFENTSFQKHLATFGNGILEHRAAISWDDIKGQYIPLPPKSEQEKILSFLDHEIAKTDILIAKQEKLIELLKEKRQSVISHAVTKGLNPDIPMKDSGVEWLGEVPEHWVVTKLGYLGKCQNGLNIGGDSFGSGYPFISYGDVYKNLVLPKSGSGLVLSSDSDRLNYSVHYGDTLFTRTSETVDEIGFSSTCLSTIENATFAGFLIRFRPKLDTLNPSFSKYYFRNEKLRAFFVKEMNLVTRASLSQELLKKMVVTLPSLQEQQIIADYLDNKEKVFSTLISRSQSTINLIKERKSALISAAVTGKIDVRDWEPK